MTERGDTEMMTARLADRMGAMAEIGADPGGGITRLAFSPLERAAHRQFAEWAAEDGARCETDPAGNTVAVYREGERYFLLGSHLDTVVHGGAFDGAAGVIGAMESARLAKENLEQGVRVVAFTGEEGARFGRPNLGSASAAGLMSESAMARLHDNDGITLAEAAAAVDLDPAATPRWLNEDVICYAESHIEQGRQLEDGSARIGLVDAIAGSTRMRFEIRGRSDHSGATPMGMRVDALAAAAELVLAVEEAGRRYHTTVATVGRMEVRPNNLTTIPGEVRVWVDVRDIDADLQRQTASTILGRSAEIVESRGVAIDSEVIAHQAPVVLDSWPRMICHLECDARGLTYRVMSSGAGHDAAIAARRTPSTMVFIPCLDGISHSPQEYARIEDIATASELIGSLLVRADASRAAQIRF